MSTERPYSYPQNAKEATLRLSSEIKDEILQSGPISFSQYMELALYHPDHGYYTRGHQNVGKAGDFFTSVSVGSTFGIILAHRIFREWNQQGKPEPFQLIELGANTAQLAKDILDTLRDSFSELYAVSQYHIVEHLEVIQSSQKATLSEHTQKLQHHDHLNHIGKHGVILSNELIDAFPVHLLQYQDHIWQEQMVGLDENEDLTFTLQPLSAELSAEISAINSALPTPPDGYQTEYRPAISSFLKAARNALDHALTLTIDYGHTRSSYYAASRMTGTLRCYHQHQADEEPLTLPGLKDITAHVDFTQYGDSLREAGFHLTHFSSQSHYLTTQGADWLTGMEKSGTLDFKLIRQFQTLTHPTTMGHQFHMLEAHTHLPENSDTLEKLEILQP